MQRRRRRSSRHPPKTKEKAFHSPFSRLNAFEWNARTLKLAFFVFVSRYKQRKNASKLGLRRNIVPFFFTRPNSDWDERILLVAQKERMLSLWIFLGTRDFRRNELG